MAVFSGYWTATPQFNLEFKFNYNDNPQSSVPTVPIGYQPPFDPVNPGNVGYFCDGGLCNGVASLRNNIDNFKRLEYRLAGSYLTNFLGGSHLIKLGGYYSDNEEEKITLANGWGSIVVNNSASNCLGQNPCYRARFNPNQPAQISRGRTIGLYLQDQATWDRLTVNLGVLVNQDKFIPNDNGTFVIVRATSRSLTRRCFRARTPTRTRGPARTATRTPSRSPSSGSRASASPTRPTPKVHDKIYVNAARYDNMDNQFIARAAAPFRALQRGRLLEPDNRRADVTE